MDSAFTLAWQRAVGHVFPEDLPMAAAELLAEGLDSPTLRDLAGRSRNDDTTELDALLRRAVAELGVSAPDHTTAERCLLHHLSSRLASGELTPKEVAARVWHGMAETATEPELRFLTVATEECCSCCLDSLELRQPEAFHSWEIRLRAAAAVLGFADDNPLDPGPPGQG